MKMTACFKTGDRVRYQVSPDGCGNADLDGCVGTVVYVDGTACPYTVVLDELYTESVTEVRTERALYNCWWCRAVNLVKIPGPKPKTNMVAEAQRKWRKRLRKLALLAAREADLFLLSVNESEEGG